MLAHAPANATLPTTDLGRARQFYANTLGLTPESEDEGNLLGLAQSS